MTCPNCKTVELVPWTSPLWLADGAPPKATRKCNECEVRWSEFEVIGEESLLVNLGERPQSQPMSDFLEEKLKLRHIH